MIHASGWYDHDETRYCERSPFGECASPTPAGWRFSGYFENIVNCLRLPADTRHDRFGPKSEFLGSSVHKRKTFFIGYWMVARPP